MKTYSIYINDIEIELYDPNNIDLAITLAIADANDLTSRKAGNTKTIKIPATATNKQIFGHPNDINSVVDVDQSVKPKVRIDADGTQIFRGYAKVNCSTDLNGINITEYEINCIGDNGDWINNISGKKISDIDYSDQNHYRTQAAQTGSEYTINGHEYVYDLIDRGSFSGQPYGTFKETVSIMDRYPALSISSIIKRIFNNVGYKIESNFFNTDFFKSLYWIFTEGKLNVDQSLIAGLTCDMRSTTNRALDQKITSGSSATTVILNRTISNVSGSFGQVHPNKYFCNYSGKYEVFGFVYMFATLSAPTDPVNVYINLMCKNNYIGTEKSLLLNSYVFTNAQEISRGATVRFNFGESNGDANSIFDLQFGDELYFVVYSDNASLEVFNARFNVKSVSAIYEIGEGKYFDFNLNLPITPQLDYIQALKEMFNLYFVTDVDSRTVYIEPYDDFYSDPIEDWSNKIDVGKDIKINFTGSELSKILRYKYKDDSNDKFVQNWEKDNLIPFASDDSQILNVFAKDEVKIIDNKVFSATWMDKCARIGLTNTYIPRMWSDTSLPPHSTKFNPRILVYQGIKTLPTGETWRMNAYGDRDLQKIFPLLNIRTNYPSFIFYDDLSPNDNNLCYNDRFTSHGLQQKYFRNKQNTIDDGRQYIGYLNLNDVDISNINFRSKKYIEINGNGAYFILDKISDFKSQDKTSTLCLFTKVGSIPLLRKLNYTQVDGNGHTANDDTGQWKSKKAIDTNTDGTEIMVHGKVKFKINDDGAVLLNDGEIVEIENNIIYPVYYKDSTGNWEKITRG